MRLLVMATSSSAEDYTGDCDYGVMALTEDLLGEVLSRQGYLEQLKTIDDATLSLRFWDYKLTYLSHTEFEEIFKPSDAAEENLSNQGWHIFNFKKDPVPSGAGQSVELPIMAVYDDNFYWIATPKHSNIEVVTSHLTTAQLRSFFAV